MLSREHRLSNLIGNFKCFEQVYEITSRENDNFLSNAFIENSQTLEVKSIQWNPEHPMLTFGKNYSLLSAEQITEQIALEQMNRLGNRDKILNYFRPSRAKEAAKDYKTFRIKVKLLEVEWLYDNLNEFYSYLGGVSSD